MKSQSRMYTLSNSLKCIAISNIHTPSFTNSLHCTCHVWTFSGHLLSSSDEPDSSESGHVAERFRHCLQSSTYTENI